MRKICVVVGSRANYSSIKSVMKAIKDHPDLKLQVIAMASAVLDRYGNVSEQVIKDGFTIDAYINMIIEGESPITMAKSTGLGLLELPTILSILKPDIVVTVGDRYETMATVISAAYMNIPLAHTMGGEVTGTIDESIRHAATKFAHIHFPACSDAKERIIRLGETPENVHLVGCPRIDLVANVLRESNGNLKEIFSDGVGENVDLTKPFVLLSQHPVTTEYGQGEHQINISLQVIRKLGIQAIILWPNSDAGSEDISRGIRKFREKYGSHNMHFFKNLSTDTYIKLLDRTACLVGNSSSGIREGAFIGTPVVNIGSRQNMRQRGKNVIDVDYNISEIELALIYQIKHGKYNSEPIYGDGSAGEKIAEILSKCNVNVQKRITY